ncbi:MAG: hypothetical protein VCA74_00755 [Deltaproteobacteria bacterium]
MAADPGSTFEGVFQFAEVENPAPGPWHILVSRQHGVGPFQLTASVV